MMVMFRALKLTLEQTVTRGDLSLVDTSGHVHRFGDRTGQPIVVRLVRPAGRSYLGLDPGLAIAEAYMDGALIVERGRLYDFLALVMSNAQEHGWPGATALAQSMRRMWKWVQQFNPLGRARRNVAHHYDIDRRVYELFLDRDLQYSCAYFENATDTLDSAQLAKKRHIASKLALEDGQSVLDIGSGWGGLALYLVERTGAEVTGITLSREQLSVARRRARQSGLADKAQFRLEDYREIRGTFDRIVSVGMFEHVGVTHYKRFFRTIYRHLNDGGVALLHSIGRSDGPAATNPFIAKYIFPGGYIPALSEVFPAIERAGLYVTDVEILRLHYAETLRAWRQRFLRNRLRISEIQGEKFCRMWEFYLSGSEAAFRFDNLMVFQIQLSRSLETLPLTRDYLVHREARLRDRDHRIAEVPRLAGE